MTAMPLSGKVSKTGQMRSFSFPLLEFLRIVTVSENQSHPNTNNPANALSSFHVRVLRSALSVSLGGIAHSPSKQNNPEVVELKLHAQRQQHFAKRSVLSSFQQIAEQGLPKQSRAS